LKINGQAAERFYKAGIYLYLSDLFLFCCLTSYIGGIYPSKFIWEVKIMNKTYLRGDIFYADLGKGVGSEQEGYRPVVIIQNNVGNRHSPTVIVAAISSRTATKSKLPTHYYIGTECGLEQPSIVLLEQLRTIDKRRLNNFVGRLSAGQITEMNHALAKRTLVEGIVFALCSVLQ
jgi:mRNA-degrading endonuclease toxin of MazEF toxin-antitoxin module